jgi:cathepsin L
MFAFFAFATSAVFFAPHEEKSFVSWMRTTNQVYTGEEYQLRLGIYLANSRFVREHNAANLGYTLELNQFAAWTPAEYKLMLGHRDVYTPVEPERAPLQFVGAPDSIDYRAKGVVNAIKDQGQCGSCWAFGVCQACESAYGLKRTPPQLWRLSEQELLDCVTTCGGCNGGVEAYALDWIIKNQGGLLMLEDDYKYTGKQGSCRWSSSKGTNKIASYQRGAAGNEDSLKNLVGNVGPADVAIDASKSTFQLYKAGIYNDPSCSSKSLDHAVGVVGYGSEGGVAYWIVRNSWGAAWGEAGYVRMSRNKNNQCGIANQPLVPSAA